MPKPPKKVLKGEYAGDTPLVIFASPLQVQMAKKLHSQSDMAGI